MRAAVVALVLVAGCARQRPPIATVSDARRANVELALLERGRSLLVTKCSNCHVSPMPHDHTAGEWPKSLDEMSVRSNLDGEQRRAIEQYLVTMTAR